jgi:glycerophosphoryl diester phosphodiesterase
MAAPAWLTARPIAHRGLHDRAKGVIENSLTAATAAVERRYAIECDVQLSSDGELIVFHDDDLDRLTDESGPVHTRSLAALTSITLKDSTDTIPTLTDLLTLIAGRVPLICEIKSAFDGRTESVKRCAEILAHYSGPVAIKSFDPEIVAAIRHLAPNRPRGFIGESHYQDPEWSFLSPERKMNFATLEHLKDTHPDFLSWYQRDLEEAGPVLGRLGLGLPLMTWTIRTPSMLPRVRALSDQIVFEGFLPEEHGV